MKWVRVSTSTVSLAHSRDVCSRPASMKKDRDVWRLTSPVQPPGRVAQGRVVGHRVEVVVEVGEVAEELGRCPGSQS
jgi:hypothetical protein